MQLSHTHRSLSASFDDPNLVSAAGLVPVMALAAKKGLRTLVDEWVKLPGYFGANAGMKMLARSPECSPGAIPLTIWRSFDTARCGNWSLMLL